MFEVGKRHPFPALRDWFACLYQVLLGQPEGPRFGGFVALYGIAETIALIEAALARPGGRRLSECGRAGARRTAELALRHLPALLGVALLIGAIYVGRSRVPPPQAGRHRARAEAMPAGAGRSRSLWTVLSYGVLTLYDRLGTIYAGHRCRYGRVAFASFCAYALSHNLGFAAVSGAAVRYRLYAHWGLTPLQIAKVVAFCSLTFGLGGMVLGGVVLFFEPRAVPLLGSTCRAGCCMRAARCSGRSSPAT